MIGETVSDVTNDEELMNVFYEETQSLINEMRKDMPTLRGELVSNDEGQQDKSSIICRLYQCAHTIKGSSGIVGFAHLQEVAQALEKTFKAARDNKLKINTGTITLLSESIEVCQKILREEETVDYEEMLKRLGSILRPS
jgi:two-component system chemotaxis sensor kinase CheA